MRGRQPGITAMTVRIARKLAILRRRPKTGDWGKAYNSVEFPGPSRLFDGTGARGSQVEAGRENHPTIPIAILGWDEMDVPVRVPDSVCGSDADNEWP